MDNPLGMEIVGGAYGGADPRVGLRAALDDAKGSLETALGHWSRLDEDRKLEMLAACLLSLNKMDMRFGELDLLRMPPVAPGLAIDSGAARPSLVDLRVDEATGRAMARVKLEFKDQALIGESECSAGLGRDHAAPARATLEALVPVLEAGLSLEDARVLQIVDGPFAVVTLRNNNRLLVGSALIEDDLGVAMARATLDAANRFINGLGPNKTIQLN